MGGLVGALVSFLSCDMAPGFVCCDPLKRALRHTEPLGQCLIAEVVFDVLQQAFPLALCAADRLDVYGRQLGVRKFFAALDELGRPLLPAIAA